ncbi:RloB family protein [Daejeonella sp.]|uniref:RloB family protein n=1 Tax=Daejeonella sp. TaxID=2805397 RepID=UPI0025C56620|nr:RloB family protein [Daejeonella sp.]
MARKIKFDSVNLKRWERKEAKRKINFKTKRRQYLIVCEGERTEPNYFESLKLSLPKGVLDVADFNIIGKGFNTESLVKKAIELREKWQSEAGREIDKLWVVFDKDDFPSLAFNNAIQLCKNTPRVEAAWSNEAFEIWYLQHFEYCEASLKRNTFKDRIEKHFKNNGLKNFKYAKNRTDMFDLLNQHGSLNFAIKNAKKLELSYNSSIDFSNQNPCTTVYKLVAELLELEKTLTEL